MPALSSHNERGARGHDKQKMSVTPERLLHKRNCSRRAETKLSPLVHVSTLMLTGACPNHGRVCPHVRGRRTKVTEPAAEGSSCRPHPRLPSGPSSREAPEGNAPEEGRTALHAAGGRRGKGVQSPTSAFAVLAPPPEGRRMATSRRGAHPRSGHTPAVASERRRAWRAM